MTESDNNIKVREKDLYLHASNFQGGQLSKFYDQWVKSTSDKSILNIIKGDNIYFEEFFPKMLTFLLRKK